MTSYNDCVVKITAITEVAFRLRYIERRAEGNRCVCVRDRENDRAKALAVILCSRQTGRD